MRSSTAGIAERNGRYLVALRRPGSSIGEKWEFPGGKVDEGETPEEALKREFSEEFDVDITVGTHFCSGTFSNKNTEYHLLAYYVRILSESFLLKEHQRLRWCSIAELRNLPMADSDKIILRCIEERAESAD